MWKIPCYSGLDEQILFTVLKGSLGEQLINIAKFSDGCMIIHIGFSLKKTNFFSRI